MWEDDEGQGRRLPGWFEERANPSRRSASRVAVRRSVERATEAGTGAPHIFRAQDRLGASGKPGDTVDPLLGDDIGGRGVRGLLCGVAEPEHTQSHRSQNARHSPHGCHRLLLTDLDATACFSHAAEILHEPAPCVPYDPFPGVLGAGDGNGRNEKPFQRLSVRWRCWLPDAHDPRLSLCLVSFGDAGRGLDAHPGSPHLDTGITRRALTLSQDVSDPSPVCRE
jgi:hypothetical protein